MARKLGWMLPLTAVFAVFIMSPAGASPIGDTAAGTTSCNADQVLVQSGAADGYTVPAGNYTLTTWSTNQAVAGGSMAAVVLRPAGSAYTVVGVSGVQSSLVAGPNGPFPASIAVQGGDLLGFWVSAGTTCHTNSGGTFLASNVWVTTPPTTGETVTYLVNVHAGRLAISAEIVPVANVPVTKQDCKNDGWRTLTTSAGDPFNNQGSCVRYVNKP